MDAAEELRVLRRRPGRSRAHERLLLAPVASWMTLWAMLAYGVWSWSQPWNPGVRVPPSTADNQLVPAPSLTVTRDAILVEQKVVLRTAEVKPGLELTALRKALADRVELIRLISERGGAPFDGDLLVIADEATPWWLLAAALTEAEAEGYTRFHLVTRAAL